jgi:hypothetical protein
MTDRSMVDPLRPHILTSHLLAPLGTLTEEQHAAMADAVARIPQELADLAVPPAGGGSLRLTDHDVRTALASPDHRPATTPFAWSARTARRSLGLAAVRCLLAGDARSPAEGVRATMAESVRLARRGDRLASPVDRWLAGLSAGGMAAVQAEAVTWATRLWCALDWTAFEEPPVIGRDRWWDSPHSSLLALRSRAEVRSLTVDATGVPHSVHLVVLGGPRRPTIRSELGVVAVVEALQAPASLPPGRIVGWWADSGHVVKVEFDQALLREGVAAIGRTLARSEGVTAPFERKTRAAA